MSARISPKNTVTAYLFLAPALLGLFFLTIFPMLGVIGISLTNWTGLEKPSSPGRNYKEIFTADFYFTIRWRPRSISPSGRSSRESSTPSRSR